MINGQVDLGTIFFFLIYNRETNLCRGSILTFPPSPSPFLIFFNSRLHYNQEENKKKIKTTMMSSQRKWEMMGEGGGEIVRLFRFSLRCLYNFSYLIWHKIDI